MQRGSLVIGRQVGERIVIGRGEDKITIEVLPPKGRGAKLRVCAPVEVPVRREELPERPAA